MIPTPKDNPMTQNDEAERLARYCELAANRLKDFGAFEAGQSILTDATALIRTQAARIAELETKLQAVLRREADANRAAFAHMRRIAALEADGIAARKATAKNYARAEAAEATADDLRAENERLVDAAKEAVEALDYSVSEIADLENTLSNYRQNWQPAAAALSVLRAALQPKQEDV